MKERVKVIPYSEAEGRPGMEVKAEPEAQKICFTNISGGFYARSGAIECKTSFRARVRLLKNWAR